MPPEQQRYRAVWVKHGSPGRAQQAPQIKAGLNPKPMLNCSPRLAQRSVIMGIVEMHSKLKPVGLLGSGISSHPSHKGGFES